ncbi:MAG: hypothetical protein HYV09_36680 [Deltaproteobacteria bacterium]|nr:hypothetical protein [Deltaproteobacteria bacterium]
MRRPAIRSTTCDAEQEHLREPQACGGEALTDAERRFLDYLAQMLVQRAASGSGADDEEG